MLFLILIGGIIIAWVILKKLRSKKPPSLLSFKTRTEALEYIRTNSQVYRGMLIRVTEEKHNLLNRTYMVTGIGDNAAIIMVTVKKNGP